MRKQKLSPEASKAKAVRDKKIAMTPARREKKAENQRIGQKSDSDLHHPGNGEKPVRVAISKNRGNFGKGTKNEGTNMMGQTWLNRKINGPSAIGEGDKKKGGVKPYIAKDDADYAKRTQMYSDSLSVHNQYKNQIQPDFEITSTSWNSKDAKEEHQKLKVKVDANDDYIYEPLEESNRVQDAVRAKYRGQWEKLEGSRGVIGGPYEKLSHQMSEEVTKAGKPFWDIVNQREAEVGKDNNEMEARMRYLKSQHYTTKNNQLKFEFNKPDPNFTVKGMKPEKWEKKTKEGTSYYTGNYEVIENQYGSVFGNQISNDHGLYSKRPDYVQYSPKFKKPKQEVRPQNLEKMPILKGSIKLASPKIIDRKLTSRKFTTSLNNPNPIKNSTAYKNYGEVNFGDGRGNKVLNKDQFVSFEKFKK